MSSIDDVRALMHAGRYRAALDRIELCSPAGRDYALLKAELLARTGDTAESRRLLDTLAGFSLSDTERSHFHYIAAWISSEEGDADIERHHLSKSLRYAEKGRDLRRLCLAQLRLISIVGELDGWESVGPQISIARRSVITLGDPTMTAALHLQVGDLEGKRGGLRGALCHATIARRLLEKSPNASLEWWAHNTHMAVALLSGDFSAATEHARAALQACQASGDIVSARSYHGNMTRLRFSTGDFESALVEANAMLSLARNRKSSIGAVETEARVYFAQGLLDRALSELSIVRELGTTIDVSRRYSYRHSLLTKAEVFARLGRYSEGLLCTDKVIDLAKLTGDAMLAVSSRLIRAEILLALERRVEAQETLGSVAPAIANHSCEIYALYERVLACALAEDGDVAAAAAHHDRARRIYDVLRNRPAQIELARSWASVRRPAEPRPPRRSEAQTTSGQVLENVALLLMHASRPELLASGLLDVLRDTGCVAAAVAVMRDAAGREEILGTVGETSRLGPTARTLSLGTIRGQTVELRIAPPADLASQATVNSVEFLLSTVHDLERARAEREERLTLWPDDEIVSEDGSTIATGKMRELMLDARRVATTTVNVLITGESGTGKEILARAIHTASTRARKPFVAFNCAAIPKELLESQLFGFRRGAFTGAERDQSGMIRAARDGTLFLDEIGELSLDLQPKLLRFLESGEISPLGEPHPLKVDVRIVAATNANLLQLVEEGRFREDLFYRLNVVPLTIPPLRERRDEIPALVRHFTAKVAAEFDKGHVRVAEETMEHLLLYAWPGNVRQLQNELRRMIALAERDAVLEPDTLSKAIHQQTRHVMRPPSGLEMAIPLTDKLSETIAKIEREMIRVALRAHEGRVEAAARALGISRKGLYLKRQRLGL